MGRNLRKAREELDASQAELGRRADLDAQQISKWERAVYMPSDESLAAIADATGHDITWFFADHDEEPVPA